MIQKKVNMSALSAAADTVDHLGERVRAARLERGISLRACGEQAGVSHTIIDRLEHGSRVGAGTVSKLLRWLDTPWEPPEPREGD